MELKKRITGSLEHYSTYWIKLNLFAFSLLHNTQWEVSGLEEFNLNESYFVISNHQSFVDVFALQKVLTDKAPPFKYFMKQSLIWMPLIGPIWWALDCIFMKRYPKSVLEKHPHLRAVDMETTHRQCLKFKDRAVTIVSFIEGTRLTEKKHKQQHSPYQYLLKPKVGGLAYMLAAMEGQIKEVIDVTIHYPDSNSSFWAFLCGNIEKIHIHVSVLPIPKSLLRGDYLANEGYRAELQNWVNHLWAQKDQRLILLEKNNT